MPETRFRPELDSVVFEGPWDLAGEEEAGARLTMSRALEDALASLKIPFGGLLDLYKVKERSTVLIEGEIPPDFLRRGGMALVALDYFIYRTPVPRLTAYKGSTRRRTVRLKKMRSFIQRRLLHSLQDNAPVDIAWLAVLYFIPDAWLPESLLLQTVENEIRQAGICENWTVSLDLKLPFHGGIRWLRDNSLKQWSILKEHIDKGDPWPVELVRETAPPDLFSKDIVVVYGYDETGEGRGRLQVYDAGDQGVAHTIEIDFTQPVLSATETLPALDRGALRGLRCKSYSPVRPPSFGLFRMCRFMPFRKLIWEFKRKAAFRRIGEGAAA
jgi:hypothetical protein